MGLRTRIRGCMPALALTIFFGLAPRLALASDPPGEQEDAGVADSEALPERPHTITGHPRGLLYGMLLGQYEYGFTLKDSVSVNVGVGVLNGYSLFVVGGGYSRYVIGDYSTGGFVSVGAALAQVSDYYGAVTAAAVGGSFGGKRTFDSSFVLSGAVGVAVSSDGYISPQLDVGLGIAL